MQSYSCNYGAVIKERVGHVFQTPSYEGEKKKHFFRLGGDLILFWRPEIKLYNIFLKLYELLRLLGFYLYVYLM